MNQTAAECHVDEDTFNDAKKVWLRRLKDAQDELFERTVLVNGQTRS